MEIELEIKPYTNSETGELQLYRFVIQHKFTGDVVFDENSQEILKFYSKENAKQYIKEELLFTSNYKIRKVGANTIADLTVMERTKRENR